ncbi:3-ketoacyl-CoA synthase 12-like [Asparagus officinalis]|uniref:3-ketoacyl-CoA synthase 12-like n=1 Tax=Asparagus officinalis TaxID=4686 RepID=UPI00098DEE9B|nr:3-ketoacyl-CoA synthase 12-like [Asparagus officinalis]
MYQSPLPISSCNGLSLSSLFFPSLDIFFLLSTLLILYALCPLWKLLQQWRNRGCYLIDFVCFKPSDDRKIPTDFCGKILKRNECLGLEEYRFLLKIIVSSGLGEHTYGPRNILEGRENSPTHDDSISEMDECFFATLDDLFTRTGFSPSDVDVLVLNVSMFCPAPSLSARIINKYRMREDVRVFNLSGMGCSASVIALDLVQNVLKCHEETLALLVTSESIAPNWYSGNRRSMMLGNCLFRSGGCSVLLSNDPKLRHRAKFQLKQLVRTHLGKSDRAHNAAVHTEDEHGHGGMDLSKDLPKAAAQALLENLGVFAPKILPVKEIVRYAVLNVASSIRRRRRADQKIGGGAKVIVPNLKAGVDHFCVHTGGTLHRFGNTSGSSVWYVLGYLEAKKRLKKGERVMMISVGGGFKCNSCLWVVMKDLDGEDDTGGAWKDCIDEYPPQTLVNPYLEKFGWLYDDNQAHRIEFL